KSSSNPGIWGGFVPVIGLLAGIRYSKPITSRVIKLAEGVKDRTVGAGQYIKSLFAPGIKPEKVRAVALDQNNGNISKSGSRASTKEDISSFKTIFWTYAGAKAFADNSEARVSPNEMVIPFYTVVDRSKLFTSYKAGDVLVRVLPNRSDSSAISVQDITPESTCTEFLNRPIQITGQPSLPLNDLSFDQRCSKA
ncbi:MAG: hypothetical protein SFT81_00005, partial [Candidatus Caenarcaniphilales bacterium]|nr:hypothetical protein [Candidatus Caenarcaniphilales bacterium]